MIHCIRVLSRRGEHNLKYIGWKWGLTLILLLSTTASSNGQNEGLNEIPQKEVHFVLAAPEDVGTTSTKELNLFELDKSSNITKSARPKKVPNQVELTAQVGVDLPVTSASKMNGSPKHTGKLNHTDFGESLGKVPKLIFTSFGGTGKKKKKKRIEFQRMNVDVPIPQFWKMDENGHLFGEDAQVWYGVNGTANAMVMVNMEGDLVGSIHDGTDSFSFQTEYVNEDVLSPFNLQGENALPPKKIIKYSVTGLKDLKMGTVLIPPTYQASNVIPSANSSQEMSGDTRRTLRGPTRRTQVDCDDIEGWLTSRWFPFFQVMSCDGLSKNPSLCVDWGNAVGSYGFTARQACCACGEGVQLIDVMVISQSSTQRVDMLNIINLSIYQTNIALSNSGTNGRLRLIRHYHNEVAFDSSGPMQTVLSRLKDAQNVAMLRDQNGADLVHFIGDTIETGIGYLFWSRIYGFALSRTNRAAMSGDYTFAHETGHNLGCWHDRDQHLREGGIINAGSFNYGYIDASKCVRDIMAYPGNTCARTAALQYSNIKNQYNGVNIGSSGSDCARAITANTQAIKRFTTTVVTRTVELCKHEGCAYGSYRASHLVGDWGSMPEDIGDNQLSQVYIPRGFSFEYFEHGNFGGWSGCFGSSTSDIILNMGGHNDAVSSFKVRLLPFAQVKLCRNSDCNGGVYYASVGSWTSMPSEIGNDALSFVYIPWGFKFQYFEHGNFGGWSGTFGSLDYNINLSMGGHNDAVSSFKISVL